MNYLESPNKSSRKGNDVGGIIGHFTAGGEINGTARYMCNLIINKETGKPYEANAAVHIITGRPGESIRLVPDNMMAWHAGSKTTKPKLNGKGSLNLWTLGHEICNWGGLREHNGKFYCWPGNWTKEYKGPEPIHIPKRNEHILTNESFYLKNGNPAFQDGIIEYWEPYTDEQIKEVIRIWKDWTERYQITKEWIAGHEEVDPTRKIDPGPAFPWDNIFNEIFPKQEKFELPTLLPSVREDEEIVEQEMIVRHDERKNERSILFGLCDLI
ncbi:N-acetylmuramoyl-L-alanine amidase [Candidatus Pacearchaeota archaeon]|nr:N-acetylmuramoyl-L-alanine amidase [Candidatus Pacearchaeota archaeon]